MISSDLENIAIANLLDFYAPRINKYALDLNYFTDLGKSALSGLQSAIMDVIHNAWDPEHPVASFAGMALDVAVMSTFGIFGNILIDACMDIFGVSFKDIIIKVQKMLAGDMANNGGAAPSESTIEQRVDSTVGGGNNASDHLTAANYAIINKALNQLKVEMRKVALINATSDKKIALAGGLWGTLKALLGFGAKASGRAGGEAAVKLTFGSFIKNIVKTIFKFFFIKTAAKAVANVVPGVAKLLSPNSKDDSISLPWPGKATTLKEVNWGKELERTPTTGWVLPVSENRIQPLIVGWATTIYPELKGHEELIALSKNFQI
jgi:hypothetical protein